MSQIKTFLIAIGAILASIFTIQRISFKKGREFEVNKQNEEIIENAEDYRKNNNAINSMRDSELRLRMRKYFKK